MLSIESFNNFRFPLYKYHHGIKSLVKEKEMSKKLSLLSFFPVMEKLNDNKFLDKISALGFDKKILNKDLTFNKNGYPLEYMLSMSMYKGMDDTSLESLGEESVLLFQDMCNQVPFQFKYFLSDAITEICNLFTNITNIKKKEVKFGNDKVSLLMADNILVLITIDSLILITDKIHLYVTKDYIYSHVEPIKNNRQSINSYNYMKISDNHIDCYSVDLDKKKIYKKGKNFKR